MKCTWEYATDEASGEAIAATNLVISSYKKILTSVIS